MELFILSILIFATEGSVIPNPETTSVRPMICNNDTNFQCVCGPEPPISKEPILCEYFIQSRELPVIDMRARDLNLEAHLHTNENYETYFKRRIAQIVSAYCERQVNECPGVTLYVPKGGDPRLEDDKSVLYAADENEPPLTQENVVILKVEKEPGNITRIQFVITRSQLVESLADSQIIDPMKVKVILGSQAVPLSRILGGIKLESVRVTRMKRTLRPEDTDNKKLKVMLLIFGLFFGVCYIIGAIRIYRDCKKRRKQRKDEEGLAATTTLPNYGTLNKDESKPDRNGSITIAPPIREQGQYTLIDETDSYQNAEPKILTERQMKFMFMCDPSQLPREPTFNSQADLENTENNKPISSSKLQQQQAHPITPAFPLRKELIIEESRETVPAVVVVSSASIHEDQIKLPSLDDINNPESGKLLLGSESPPLERPQSRRGSRVDEEEIDLTEIGVSSAPIFTDLVIPDSIKAEETPLSPEHWSSSEGEAELYYKMSDEEEIQGDKWASHSNHESDEENDKEEVQAEHEEGDNFVYERLREEASPVPPPHDTKEKDHQISSY
ncbi:unnamed protein product [Auanema sp. JU1783]|nr:unnamed protein product [Auanema sp. JU1783]